ncbi:MAG: hypothetical protein OXU22_04705, partial [Gammaproteobacteria bacterium]|nr:hypothetical protein [Gammaproteobacteria bacterium]
NLNESPERFTVQVTAPDSVTAIGAAHTTTVFDDDPVTVAITRTAGTGAVGEGSGALRFTVTLAGGTRAAGVDTVMPFTVTGLDEAEFDIAAPLIDHDGDPMTDLVAAGRHRHRRHADHRPHQHQRRHCRDFVGR